MTFSSTFLDFQTVYDGKIGCLCTVTFGQKSSKLNSKPVYCSQLFGILLMWFCQRKLVVCGNFGTLGTNHNGLSFNVVNRVEDLMLSISYYFLKQRQIRQCLHLRYSQQFEKYSPIMTSWVLLTCPNLYLICVKSLFNLLVSIFLRFAQVEQPCDTTKSTTMERGHENQAIQGQG